ncbi:MBOAT family O-acyltransferase [Stutzerimonas kunmingensis]|uniref:MBOAT family O-acyltransferase n=1 Tax=Stutzerimonas kunmingensis TaxID=1211807 RepID=UPI0028AA433A|nr:MBOAT family O-acyltransferase [Stutzerimonas kunmingensis]
MIFSSYPFLLLFLPLVYAGFLLLRRARLEGVATAFLVLASLVFYAVWDWRLLGLLLVSIVANYLLGQLVAKYRSKGWLVLAVAGNLGLLAYYKYAGFLFAFIPASTGWNIVLPLGISFFTFQQIAWQVDLYRGKIERPGDPLRYVFFVSFFPQLIAGPIVHARELLPQIDTGWLRRSLPWQLGLSLLAVGLVKKVLLADSLAPGVDSLYSRAAAGELLAAPDVLLAAFSYGLQLYFDFSGYADMAMGLALLFGIRLPVNFRSPYQSGSIIEFWRRWHITLSHFLRDYLYIALGGNRRGAVRRHANLMVTMLLGGLWHGAGWQFVLWGGLHGAMLVINHRWRRLSSWRCPRPVGVVLTLVAVMLAWIPFRADSLATAARMYSGLLDWHWTWSLGDTRVVLDEVLSLRIAQSAPLVCLAFTALALLAPNSRRLCLSLGYLGRGVLVAVAFFLVLKALAGQPDRAFLYFNF